MTKQTTLYLVRHGESVSNQQIVISGHSDPHLTGKGREQARLTKLELKDVKFDAAYSSDLRRAVDTAEIVYGQPVPRAHQLSGLRERNFGSLEGMPDGHLAAGNEKKRTLPEEQRLHHKHVPDMESDDDIILRFMPALEIIAKQNQGKTVLVAAHGSAIRTVIMQITGLTYDKLPPGSFTNGSYAEMTYDGTGFKVIQISSVKI